MRDFVSKNNVGSSWRITYDFDLWPPHACIYTNTHTLKYTIKIRQGTQCLMLTVWEITCSLYIVYMYIIFKLSLFSFHVCMCGLHSWWSPPDICVGCGIQILVSWLAQPPWSFWPCPHIFLKIVLLRVSSLHYASKKWILFLSSINYNIKLFIIDQNLKLQKWFFSSRCSGEEFVSPSPSLLPWAGLRCCLCLTCGVGHTVVPFLLAF